jgi:hypothetical protein
MGPRNQVSISQLMECIPTSIFHADQSTPAIYQAAETGLQPRDAGTQCFGMLMAKNARLSQELAAIQST